MSMIWTVLLVVVSSWVAFSLGIRAGSVAIIVKMKQIGWTLTPPGGKE